MLYLYYNWQHIHFLFTATLQFGIGTVIGAVVGAAFVVAIVAIVVVVVVRHRRSLSTRTHANNFDERQG